MKFTDGYWMIRKGFTLHDPQMVYDTRITDSKVTLYCPFKKIVTRGDTLNLGMLTVEITSPEAGILHVKAYHHKGAGVPSVAFEVLPDGLPLKTEVSETAIRVASGTLTAVINRCPFRIDYYEGEKLLTSSLGKSLSYVNGPDANYMKEELSISVGENIYGLGERFTPFVKNGQSVDIWNEDGGTGSEQAYKNIPFYISNRGYGVFTANTGRVSYEIASEKVSRTQFSVEGELLDYYLIGGGSMKDVLIRYTDLTGKPGMPPRWSFGLWLSTSFTTNYNEQTVLEFIDGMLDRGIPLDVFHFDCCWMKEFEWCNFEWYPEMFPDPEGLIRKIHDRGVKVCCWINSYIGQKSAMFDEGMEKGYFLKRADGSIWQWDMWQAGQAIVDFTNPEAKAWYLGYLEKLLDMGVDCFKTDFGERIPVDAVYYDGSDPVLMHNYYTDLYNEAVFELLERKRGKNEAVLFARSATTGGQKYPVHWGGDCTSTYPSMAESLRGGLSFLMSGFGFWSHDIGGFEDGCEPDIYKRWTQFGLLSSHSRYHGSGQYKVPWLYGDEAVDVTRAFTRLKLALMPYLYQAAVQAHETGIPMMRAMVIEFPEDETCSFLDRQFMLGGDLLAAPVFSPDGTVRYYLPEGTWTHLMNGRTYEGGRWYTEQYDYLSLPLLARENAIIVMGPETPHADYDYTKDPVFCLSHMTDRAEAAVYTDADSAPAHIKAVCEKDQITITAQGFSGTKTIRYQGQCYEFSGETLVIAK